MVKVSWNKAKTEQFIAQVKKHECLYKVNAQSYLDKEKRAEALDEILLEMRKTIPDVNILDLRKKLRNVRTQYIKELRLVEKSVESGTGKVYKPTLWCYNMLTFLEAYPKKNGKSLKERSETDDEQSEYSENSSSNEEKSFPDPLSSAAECEDSIQPNNKTVKCYVAEYIKRIRHLKSYIEKRRKREYKYSWLGKMIESQMEKLSDKDQNSAAWEIQNIMHKYLSTKISKRVELTPTVKEEVSENEDSETEFIVDHELVNGEELDGLIVL